MFIKFEITTINVGANVDFFSSHFQQKIIINLTRPFIAPDLQKDYDRATIHGFKPMSASHMVFLFLAGGRLGVSPQIKHSKAEPQHIATTRLL